MSRSYQYSFAKNPDWSRWFSPGPEILRYIEGVADTCGIRPHVVFGTEIVSARFEDERWRIRTESGEESSADFLVAAAGFLVRPRYPDIEGVETFSGPVFHSSRWDHSVDLADKRVAVIGTGSTGVQIVGALGGEVGHLLHFVRTPQWIAPLPNKDYSRVMRRALRRSPRLNRLAYRFAQGLVERTFGTAVVQPGWQRRLFTWVTRNHLRRVRDPELRRKLTPHDRPMCKRLVVSPHYYRVVQREDVEVLRDDIDRVEPGGVRTADGTLHEIDVLVLATGFQAHLFMRPMEVTGEGGVTIDEAWSGDHKTNYRTVAVPGFPNLFMILGPNSPLGNVSLFPAAEAQVGYIMRWIEKWRAGEVATMAPTPEATERFDELLDRETQSTIYVTGCDSYQLDPGGRPFLWPDTPAAFHELMREPVMDDFEVRSGPAVGAPESGGAARG